ncbi:ABC transporter permease [Arenimonas caeni]|jgi:putative ABC transport system permease protein|uniref:ABC transporter permease n=1 Tax=Arenimonas caeni TaxID=2058085 RepID=UPI002A35CC32|nr:FtsX-like permease family protein [Arenimonas caeni]MDY0021987.1 ABC transporter permease [Arenimonas caeni]
MEFRPILSAMLRNKTAPLLIAAQIALTLAIVCNALYIIRDRLATASRPSGADEANVSEIRFYPHRAISDVRGMQLRDIESIRAVPGVVAAAWTNQVPLGRSGWSVGPVVVSPDQQTSPVTNAGQYFTPESIIDTFGLTLVDGRDFQPGDYIESDPAQDRNQASVVIVTRTMAERLWPGEASVLGKPVYLGGPDNPPVEVIGVVDRLQTPWANLGEAAEYSLILPVRYLDPFTRYSVRTEPGRHEQVMAEVEKVLLANSSDRVLLGRRTLAEARDQRYAGERMMAGLLIAVTVFLLLITASGIVGMASLWVNQRRKQIGVRRAIGARRADILRYFLLENLMITTAGIAAGIALAVGLNNFLVSTMDLPRLPVFYLGVTTVAMWVLGLLAVLGPAWRAAAVPPAIATRTA